MATTRPMRIPGRWRQGYVLDYHVVTSEYLYHDEYGHPKFDNQRSEVGELLYKLKYRSDTSVVEELAETAAVFIAQWAPPIELLVAVPATRTRFMQPVTLVGDLLSAKLGIGFGSEFLRRTKEVPELKNVHSYDERLTLLEGIYDVDVAAVRGKVVLLIDDLFRSGATMNAAADALYDNGHAAEVFAFALTRTKG